MPSLRPTALPEPTACPLQFSGVGVYQVMFPDSEFGVVFEDDGNTGYFYATNASATRIYDALHIYDCGDTLRIDEGTSAFVVWQPALEKAGLFIRDHFHAVFDFRNRKGYCRSGFPTPLAEWKVSHDWEEHCTDGLE